MNARESLRGIVSIEDASQGIEGIRVTNRRLKDYERSLRVDRAFLAEQPSILNFGSGGSHIAHNTSLNVVESDLLYDPIAESDVYLGFGYPLFQILNKSIRMAADEETRNSRIRLKRKLGQVEGRNLTQLDGRSLPFPDNTFQMTLSLAALYQIPFKDKAKIFNELFRVTSGYLHCSQIYRQEFDLVASIAHQYDHEIVACIPVNTLNQMPTFCNEDDYRNYEHTIPQKDRIVKPTTLKPQYLSVLGHFVLQVPKPGNILITRKMDKEYT